MIPFYLMTDANLLEYYYQRREDLERRLNDWDDEWTDKDEEEWFNVEEEIQVLEKKIKQPA